MLLYSLDVIQEFEYVKQEVKVFHLPECLQKTPPPVLIFSEKTSDVDDIHEFLLLKGLQAVAIHGGKDQEERQWSVREYKKGRKDVLVATDLISNGMDFADVQHIINYDMPTDIENYVHRIDSKTGMATTFVGRRCDDSVLRDLKALLIEARQKLPPFLATLDSHEFIGEGCA